MTVTNLPRDDDPIVQVQEGALGQKTFVATSQLIRFFQDLVAEFDTFDASETPEFRSSITRLKSIQRDSERIIQQLSQEVAELRVINSKLQSKLTDQEQRLKNLEQTQWR